MRPSASSGKRVASGRPRWFGFADWPLLAVLIASAALFVSFNQYSIVRVGDGSEYYAMFLAWRDTLRPFMTAAAWTSYAEFYQTHRVDYLVAPDALKAAFPALVSGQTADFNHFWFYGLVPALAARVLARFGTISPHAMFLSFHWVLAALPLTLSWRHYRWAGLLATIAIFLLSPMVWFAAKVHTEFFTVCFVLASVIWFRTGRFLPAALCLSIASTQNISMLAVSGIVVLMDAGRRGLRSRYSLKESLCLVAIAFTAFIHPIYYFFRFGAATPQFVAGGASVGANLRTFYLWFLDPDLGLIPNWPFIVGVVLIAGFASMQRRVPSITENQSWVASTRPWAIYVVAYLAINLLAQSSTENLNSGATPGLARYAVWYIPLFFPPLLLTATWACVSFQSLLAGRAGSASPAARNKHWENVTLLSAIGALACGAAWYTLEFDRPSLTEAGAYAPSWSSQLIQRWLPTAYDPPAEVFMERYGGVGENPVLNDARAIVGPDCRKILLRGPEHQRVFGGAGCVFSATKLKEVLRLDPLLSQGPFPRYVHLSSAQMLAARPVIAWNEWQHVGLGNPDQVVLGPGWGENENWGIWSSGPQASIVIPCGNSQMDVTRGFDIELALRPFLAPGHSSVSARFTILGASPVDASFSLPDVSERTVTLRAGSGSCHDLVVKIDIAIMEPASPAALGLSDDPRMLGLGLSRFRLVRGQSAS